MRGFVTSSPRDLAYALKSFTAVFAVLASTGLLFTGRFGLALVTLAATVMAIRALIQGARGADPMRGAAARGGASGVETDLLAMRLDHATGEVDGQGQARRHCRPRARSLGLTSAGLLAEARRDDPPSTRLMQAYLDRRLPDWRAGRRRRRSARRRTLDDRTALDILGLPPDAGRPQSRRPTAS